MFIGWLKNRQRRLPLTEEEFAARSTLIGSVTYERDPELPATV